MSRTLFLYVFKDLIRIFLLASGALAGIMSFGGLLRPLYEHGLDAGQVFTLLGYFMPAMMTYSLPVAALFATTIVYGRLSADNEVTAARAAGISHMSLAMPALVMGLTLALLSLLFLCFIVPVFWLKIERLLYSNLAELVANRIQRTHQIRFEHASMPVTIFAQDAEVIAPEANQRGEQIVRLIAPWIVTYDQSDRNRPPIPEEFYTARSATAVIRHADDDSNVVLYASLDRGMRFPRRPGESQRQNVQVSVGSTNFGPVVLPSPVRENTKFMDIFRLRKLLNRPEHGRRVRAMLTNFVMNEQQEGYLLKLKQSLSGESDVHVFTSGPDTYLLHRGGATLQMQRGRLVLEADDGAEPIRLIERHGRDTSLDVEAREVRVRAFADLDADRIDVAIELIDAVVTVDGERAERPNFSRYFGVPTPPDLASLEKRSATDYLTDRTFSSSQQQGLAREVLRLTNGIISELHARASFGVSCFILVMVGCALGMMFRSGNFLSAFALSVIPALLSIALIVTGQHTSENIPWNVNPAEWHNPLPIGLAIIWSGNAAVAAIGAVLLWRLQRQ